MHFLRDNRFFRFLLVGGTGAFLNLGTTYFLTEYLLGVEQYFTAFLVGIAVNLLFNFLMYTLAVFKTRHDHLRRILVFFFYSSVMAFLQGTSVRFITSVVGEQWYLLVIAGVIAAFAILNFFVFKLSIFKEWTEVWHARPKTVLAFIMLCAVLLRLAVLFNVLGQEGITPLVYGDALGYRELAVNLAEGEGFTRIYHGVLSDEVFRTAGLPLLLAPFASTDTGLAFYLVCLTLVAGVALPLLTYAVGIRFVPTAAALTAAALVAFEPHLVFFSILPQSEIPFILFAYAGLLTALIAVEKRALYLAALSGALFGYAAFIRPGFWPVFLACGFATLIYLGVRRAGTWKQVAVVMAVAAVVLVPWYVRNHEVTGVYALSGAGWRNVYTDYLASLRAVENKTGFSEEKEKLEMYPEAAGVMRGHVDNPASAAKLRDFALAELWERREGVVVLETTLLASFFLQDGYYYQMRRFLLLPSDTVGHQSVTFTLLSKGVAGIPDVFEELARQRFIPIWGRAFTLLIFLGAIAGFFLIKSPLRYLFALVIALSALTATAIGLGVESRLRLPVQPLLFLFASVTLFAILKRIPRFHAR